MKNWNVKYALGLMALVLSSCGGQKETVPTAEMAQLEEMVKSKTLHLDARWANPLSTRSMNSIANAGLLPPGSSPNRIDIIGTASYLEIRNDSVFAILPYYGERQFGSVYNASDTGIQFAGIPEDLELNYNDKKRHYEFEFDVVNEHGEGFNINGTLFPNLTTRFYVNSNERLTIGYSGNVEAPNEGK